MASVILNHSMNQFEPHSSRGFVEVGIENNETAYIDSANKYELHPGSFVMYDNTSQMKGLVVKKVGDPTKDTPIGIVTLTSDTDTFSRDRGQRVLTIVLFGRKTEIYLEAMSAFKKGDELEMDKDNGIHRVKKKTTGKKIGIALEDASNKGDIVLVLV